VYRWQPGSSARFKKTELCHTCAKLKNVCQTCVLDLEFGLPVQVRDAALEDHEKMKIPSSEVNRQFLIEQHEHDMNAAAGALTYGKVNAQPSEMLERLARRTPYYKRNLPHLCSFFAKGSCNRGQLCPYRHEMPVTGDLANQNIKDRYYGQNDPVAKKLMHRYKNQAQPKLDTPEDKTVTTLWVGGVEGKVMEEDLREKFGSYGIISSLTVLPTKGCAFITFLHRLAAEEAAKALVNNLVIKGKSLRIAWGKKASTPLQLSPEDAAAAAAASNAAASNLSSAQYPSQDPRQMASKLAQS